MSVQLVIVVQQQRGNFRVKPAGRGLVKQDRFCSLGQEQAIR